MTEPLTGMTVTDLLIEFDNWVGCGGIQRRTEIRDELERRIASKPTVTVPIPLADLSIGELLYEFRNGWDVCNYGGLQRGHDIRCEVERRVQPAPVPPTPIERMTSEELQLERDKRHAEMGDATHRFNLVVMAIYSRRYVEDTPT